MDKKNGRRKSIPEDRRCAICGSSKTSIANLAGGHQSICWHRFEGGYVCKNCYQRQRRIEINEEKKATRVRLEFDEVSADDNNSKAELELYLRLNEKAWASSIFNAIPHIKDALRIIKESEKRWGHGGYDVKFSLPDLEDGEELHISDFGDKFLIELIQVDERIALVHISPLRTVDHRDEDEMIEALRKSLGQ